LVGFTIGTVLFSSGLVSFLTSKFSLLSSVLLVGFTIGTVLFSSVLVSFLISMLVELSILSVLFEGFIGWVSFFLSSEISCVLLFIIID
jgi:hypothetical protein